MPLVFYHQRWLTRLIKDSDYVVKEVRLVFLSLIR